MNKIVIKIFVIVLFVTSVLIFHNYILYVEKKNYETIDYKYQIEKVKEVYELYPEDFDFDSYGECKITVEQIHTAHDDYGFEIENDKYGNMCIGYFIIKKIENGIEIDASHICDMINY